MANRSGFLSATFPAGGWNPESGAPAFTGGSMPTGYGDSHAAAQFNALFPHVYQPNEAGGVYTPGRTGWGAPSWGVGNNSAWGSTPGGPSAVNAGWGLPKNNTTPGVTTLRSDKSPAGNAALEAVLGQIHALTSNPNQPAQTTVRDPALQQTITGANQNFNAATGEQNQSFGDWVKAFQAGQGDINNQTSADVGTITRLNAPVTDPNSVAATNRDLETKRYQAEVAAAQRASNQALLASRNINRSGFGGGSSMADAALADAVAGIHSKAALDLANVRQANAWQLLHDQLASTGQREALTNAALARGLQPIQAGAQLQGNQLANLNALIAARNGNNLDQTAQQFLAGQLANIGAYGQGTNLLNQWGVGGSFNSPALSWSQPNRSGWGGGGDAGNGQNGPNGTVAVDGNGFMAGPGNGRLPGSTTANANQQDWTIDPNTGMIILRGEPGFPTQGLTTQHPYVPQVPNYGPADAGGGTVDAAQRRYHDQSGFWPQTDPNFSPELMDWSYANG